MLDPLDLVNTPPMELHIAAAIHTICPKWTVPTAGNDIALPAPIWKWLASTTASKDTWTLAATILLNQLPYHSVRITSTYARQQQDALNLVPWECIPTSMPLDQLKAHALIYSAAVKVLHRCSNPLSPDLATHDPAWKDRVQQEAHDRLQELETAWLRQERAHISLSFTAISTPLGPDIAGLIAKLQIWLTRASFQQIAHTMNGMPYQ